MSTVPPCGASTRAAALANRSAKSTVIGCSPTRPRTPSVPKNLRAIEICSLCNRSGNADRVDRGGHVVGAHDTRSVENRNGSQCDAARSSIINCAARERLEHGLARQSRRQYHAQLLETAKMFEQRQIVRDALAEPEARIRS